MFNNKSIKLGKIKKGQIVGMSDSAVWDLDVTIAIFLRDALRKFVQSTHSFPSDTEDADENEFLKWLEKLNSIASKFDLYVRSGDSFLSDDEKEFLAYYKWRYNSSDPESRERVTENDQQKMTSIMLKLDEVAISQKKALSDAIEELKENYFDLWD